MEILALILFISILLLILYGYPVSFTLGGVSLIYLLMFVNPVYYPALPQRIMGTMSNYVLLAVPLFIFMGIMLEKSGLAESMLDTMGLLFGKIRGGLAVSVILVGALLAASTGIVGATVITMGLISLPTMLRRGYSPTLATGTIAASGTLGQIIPPSIVLVLLGSVLNVSVGQLFRAAFIPGVLLVLCYIIYVLVIAQLKPEMAPPVAQAELDAFWQNGVFKKVVIAFVMPLLLIVLVLGSIFFGIASPTEAAAVGAFGASLLTIAQGKLSWTVCKKVMEETTHLTCMVFLILLGATTFSFVFRQLGGDHFLVELITQSDFSATAFLVLVMLIIFVAGFFIDFIEIIFIIVPVVAPIFIAFDINLIWIGVLIALNLQTSFLTPPFGFSLFYLKGVAPPEVTTNHLYKGIIPFVIIQVIFLLMIMFFPWIIGL